MKQTTVYHYFSANNPSLLQKYYYITTLQNLECVYLEVPLSRAKYYI